jgi:hypothetical protein
MCAAVQGPLLPQHAAGADAGIPTWLFFHSTHQLKHDARWSSQDDVACCAKLAMWAACCLHAWRAGALVAVRGTRCLQVCGDGEGITLEAMLTYSTLSRSHGTARACSAMLSAGICCGAPVLPTPPTRRWERMLNIKS